VSSGPALRTRPVAVDRARWSGPTSPRGQQGAPGGVRTHTGTLSRGGASTRMITAVSCKNRVSRRFAGLYFGTHSAQRPRGTRGSSSRPRRGSCGIPATWRSPTARSPGRSSLPAADHAKPAPGVPHGALGEVAGMPHPARTNPDTHPLPRPPGDLPALRGHSTLLRMQGRYSQVVRQRISTYG
jgi:hypothetical protein